VNGKAGRGLPVDASRRIHLRRVLRDGERELLPQQIDIAQRAARERTIDRRELRGDERIDRRRKPAGASDVEQVHRAHRSIRRRVAERSQLRFRREDGSRERRLARLNRLLEIHEVEQPALPQRAAEVTAPLVEPQLVLRQPPDGIQPAVGVQRVVAKLFEQLPVRVVRSALRHELHLHGAFGAGIGGEAGRRHRDLLHGAEPHGRKRKKARPAAAEPLRVVVDPVERDVDRAAGQAVERAVPLRRAGGGTGRQQREAENVAAGQRQVRDFLVADGRRHRRRCGLDRGRTPFDSDLLPHGSHGDLNVDVAGPSRLDHDIVDDRRLEARRRRQDAVAPRLKRREHESALAPRLRGLAIPCSDVGHFHGDVRHDGARRILHGADNLAGGSNLSPGRRRDSDGRQRRTCDLNRGSREW